MGDVSGTLAKAERGLSIAMRAIIIQEKLNAFVAEQQSTI